MKRAGWSAALVAVSMIGCAAPQAQDSSEIAARAEEWVAGFNAGDVDAVVGLYTEDARLMPPNGETVRGHDAIRADFQAMVDSGLSGTMETLEAMAAGDLGYRVGTYTLNTPDGTVADRGKYIESWRLVDGEWKITNDIYNSDLEAGPAGTLVIGTHEVGDPEVWLAAWLGGDARREQFAEHGVASARVFQDPENQAMTGLLLDVVDLEALQTFLQSEEGAAAAAEDTVDLSAVTLLYEVD